MRREKWPGLTVFLNVCMNCRAKEQWENRICNINNTLNPKLCTVKYSAVSHSQPCRTRSWASACVHIKSRREIKTEWKFQLKARRDQNKVACIIPELPDISLLMGRCSFHFVVGVVSQYLFNSSQVFLLPSEDLWSSRSRLSSLYAAVGRCNTSMGENGSRGDSGFVPSFIHPLFLSQLSPSADLVAAVFLAITGKQNDTFIVLGFVFVRRGYPDPWQVRSCKLIYFKF